MAGVADEEANVDVGAFVAGAGEDDGAKAGRYSGAEGGEGDGGGGFVVFALGAEGFVVGGVAGGDGFLRSTLSGKDDGGFAQ